MPGPVLLPIMERDLCAWRTHKEAFLYPSLCMCCCPLSSRALDDSCTILAGRPLNYAVPAGRTSSLFGGRMGVV